MNLNKLKHLVRSGQLAPIEALDRMNLQWQQGRHVKQSLVDWVNFEIWYARKLFGTHGQLRRWRHYQ